MKHVLIPPRLRTLHREQVELLAFQHEPDRDGDRAPGLPPDHADLDLSVAGEAVFEVVLLVWHDTLLSVPRVVESSNSRRPSRAWLPAPPERSAAELLKPQWGLPTLRARSR